MKYIYQNLRTRFCTYHLIKIKLLRWIQKSFLQARLELVISAFHIYCHIMAFSNGKVFQRLRSKNPLQIFFEISCKTSRADFRISLFFIGTTFPIPRTSGITFDVSLADLKTICRPLEQHCFLIGTIFFKIYSGCAKSLENFTIGKRYKAKIYNKS